MKCPVCNEVNLLMSERQGIEIDYCPQCRGVWLDRGELDKLIERSVAELPSRSTAPAANVSYPPQGQQHGREYHHPQQHAQTHSQQSGYPRKKKREGFLGELFDFD